MHVILSGQRGILAPETDSRLSCGVTPRRIWVHHMDTQPKVRGVSVNSCHDSLYSDPTYRVFPPRRWLPGETLGIDQPPSPYSASQYMGAHLKNTKNTDPIVYKQQIANAMSVPNQDIVICRTIGEARLDAVWHRRLKPEFDSQSDSSRYVHPSLVPTQYRGDIGPARQQ
jgi:hypothetical protein